MEMKSGKGAVPIRPQISLAFFSCVFLVVVSLTDSLL